MLADEQNGFRRERSCEDHLFTLNSLVKNNENLYVVFIDLQMCFDFIDRDMTLYKLSLHNIDGKVFI
jgi:retron-type reverse transcriptase